jgi:hypothetical protein
VFWIPAVVFVIQFVANVTILLRAIGSEELEARASAEHVGTPVEALGVPT